MKIVYLSKSQISHMFIYYDFEKYNLETLYGYTFS